MCKDRIWLLKKEDINVAISASDVRSKDNNICHILG